MKKMFFGWLTFLMMPLTVIGGYHVVKLAHVSEAVEGFIYVFGLFVSGFQFIMACTLIVQGYNDNKVRTPFDDSDVNKKLKEEKYGISPHKDRQW